MQLWAFDAALPPFRTFRRAGVDPEGSLASGMSARWINNHTWPLGELSDGGEAWRIRRDGSRWWRRALQR